MKRILLFTVTNLAVLTVFGLVLFVVERGLGIRFAQGGTVGLLAVAAASGCGGALVSLALSKWSAKRMMGVRVITQPRTESETWLLGTVSRLAALAKIARPEVGIFEAEDMNAFATGARRNAALVAVSSGLLRGMPRAQVEAVLGHEISHVANGDMVTLTLLQGVLNTFVIFLARVIGSIVDRAIFRNDRGEAGVGCVAATLMAQGVLGILAGGLVNAYSRCREFRADRGGAVLVGAGSMIGALESLKRAAGEPLPPSLQAFGINTGTGTGAALARLFMSHPPLDARIAALRSPPV
jgi:heat shock protein HtpX